MQTINMVIIKINLHEINYIEVITTVIVDMIDLTVVHHVADIIDFLYYH